jgi:glutaredoxin
MMLVMKNNQFSKTILQTMSLLGMVLLLALIPRPATVSAQSDEVNIYLFWGEGCPHCATAKPMLEEMAAGSPRVNYLEFEVYTHEENVELFFAFGQAYNLEPKYVPTIFVGGRYWEGFSEAIGQEIQTYIDQCLQTGCEDPGRAVLQELRPDLISPHEEPSPTSKPLTPTPSITPEAITTPQPSPTPAGEPTEPGEESGGGSISLPFIGTIDLSERSLLISTLLISFVDGFNPCSIWVLSMLLAITLNTRSRKKVLVIGLVFIFVTGLVYALFIGGLFTVLKIVQFIGWIQVIVSIVALFFGLVNIKDYFWYKEGLSFTISDEKKPGIYKSIRRVLNADESIWVLIGSTIVLAAGVSLVEFSCTAGFPVLWTNLLTAQDVTPLAFLGFLLVYMIVYQIDELGIFLVSVLTLRTTKLEEKHGRILKLLGGMLMLTLAAVMIINPALMNDLVNALVIFGVAFGATGLVLLVHRLVLPKLNIRVGSED